MNPSTIGPQVFAALGDRVRLSLLQQLMRAPSAVVDLKAPVSRSAVSQHLKILKDAGLVTLERDGRRSIYRAQALALRALGAVGPAGDRPEPEPAEAAPAVPPARRRMRDSGDGDGDDRVFEAMSRWAAAPPARDAMSLTLLSRLVVLADRVRALHERVAAVHGLQGGELTVLVTLLRLGRPHQATPTELARRSLQSQPGVAKRLSSLESKGLVRRSGHPADGRSHLVTLAAPGRRVAESAMALLLDDHLAGFFALPADEVAQCNATLRRLERGLATR